MPVVTADHLPANEILAQENIFVMLESRALHQDIRSLKIAILNLMPTKITTETQLLRLLGNTPLQVEITLLHPSSHESKNTPREHLEQFYKTIDDVAGEKFDGMVITGAPVEHLPFEEATYWEELQYIMDWRQKHVYSTLYICWAAQAGLYHHFGIPKYQLPQKVFGIFWHNRLYRYEKLMRGFDDKFLAPHSRYTEVRREDIDKVPELKTLSVMDDDGVYIAATQDGRQIFVTGHSEYDPLTLKHEYERDLKKGIPIQIPANYFLDDDPSKPPIVRWKSHANLLFANWLNYYVYQETPYDWY